MKSDLLLSTNTNNKGLPGKSYTYILSLDYFIRMAMCILSNAPFFDSIISSKLSWKYKYKDREKLVNDYIKFMSIADESRINVLFSSNFFSRLDMIKLINKVNESISRAQEFINFEKLNDEQFDFMFRLKLQWGNFSQCIVTSIPNISKEINKIQTLLIEHYISFIVKGLMQRRKGENNPDKLKSDAYEILMKMINQYKPAKSKVPFHNYLKFYIRSGKNKVIQRELWGLPEGSIISLDELSEEKDQGDVVNKKLNVVEEILNNNVNSIKSMEEKRLLVEQIIGYIPKPFMDIMALQFRLIDPLQPAEEIALMMHNS